MITYKEQIKNKRNFVLVKNDVVIATFGNLRKLVDFVKDEKFPSYWTLIRKKKYPIIFNEYAIYKVKQF